MPEALGLIPSTTKKGRREKEESEKRKKGGRGKNDRRGWKGRKRKK